MKILKELTDAKLIIVDLEVSLGKETGTLQLFVRNIKEKLYL